MNRFYIQDSTIGKFVTFPTVPELVKYLSDMIPRAFHIPREQYVQNLIDLGYGYDDPDGAMLTRAISEEFNIGVISKDNIYVKTDVHTAAAFQKEEYGD
jgi:hypothetical protein